MAEFVGSLGALIEAPPAGAWQFPVGAARAGSSRKVLHVPGVVPAQLTLGSCVGQSCKKAAEILDGRPIQLSAMGAYHHGRIESGFSATEDRGVYPEAAMRAMRKYGIGSAAELPYDVARFGEEPSATYLEQARDHRLTGWWRARQVAQAIAALDQGFPVIVFFDVPPEFGQTGRDGLWHDPNPRAPGMGGHATVIYGHDARTPGGQGYAPGAFFSLNWWSPGSGPFPYWGGPVEDHPHLARCAFRIPYAAFQPGGRVYDAIVPTKYDALAGADLAEGVA